MSLIKVFMVLSSIAFKQIEGDQAPFQKLVYCIGNLLCVAMAMYKCQTMGLLPTHTSDWLAFVQPQQVNIVNYVFAKVFDTESFFINVNQKGGSPKVNVNHVINI